MNLLSLAGSAVQDAQRLNVPAGPLRARFLPVVAVQAGPRPVLLEEQVGVPQCVVQPVPDRVRQPPADGVSPLPQHPLKGGGVSSPPPRAYWTIYMIILYYHIL